MPLFEISQFVECESLDEAEKVAAERIGYDEDYGFDYRFVENPAVKLIPSREKQPL